MERALLVQSSKVHLKYFGETTTDEMRASMLAGIGENAGVVDIGDGWAVTFKVESHNHPSYIEPYQGAATGVGGIVRDIMAMGARPIAVMDQLRFGAADHADTRRVVDGVVRGIGGYGNSSACPTSAARTVFDSSYQGNPLVNARARARCASRTCTWHSPSGAGNKIILFGARTASTASAASPSSSPRRSTTAPAAAPRSCPPSRSATRPPRGASSSAARLYREKLVVGIQDLGGAGLSCATSELAAAGDGGMHIDLDLVPTRAIGMTPAEVLSSESQERMCAVVAPENVDAFMEVCKKWDVLATVIGEVTDGEQSRHRLARRDRRRRPANTIAHEARCTSARSRAPTRRTR